MKKEEYTTIKVVFIGGMRMSEEVKTIDWKAIGKERQLKYEQKINDWNNTVMHYSEGRLSFPGLVAVSTDDWGVRITVTSEHHGRPVTLSGAWEIISVGPNSMSAAYVNWNLRVIEQIKEEEE
tara:strand:+ start:378 stop:746 length:369 start_codon:yes stop_codon:yes gene_type:complete